MSELFLTHPRITSDLLKNENIHEKCLFLAFKFGIKYENQSFPSWENCIFVCLILEKKILIFSPINFKIQKHIWKIIKNKNENWFHYQNYLNFHNFMIRSKKSKNFFYTVHLVWNDSKSFSQFFRIVKNI